MTKAAGLAAAAMVFCGLIPTAFAQTNQPAEKVKVLVVYHSRGGHTVALAKAVVEGAKKNQHAEVTLKTVAEVSGKKWLIILFPDPR